RDKDTFDMVPFGARRRGCPGASMAIVSMEGDLDMTELFAGTTLRSVDLLAHPTLSYPHAL
ncbi:hypothetical protein SUGI_0421410, partial [Cryptomeria japonica]